MCYHNKVRVAYVFVRIEIFVELCPNDGDEFVYKTNHKFQLKRSE